MPSFNPLSRGVQSVCKIIEGHATFGVVPSWRISAGSSSNVTRSAQWCLWSDCPLTGQSGNARALLLWESSNLCSSPAIDQQRDGVHFRCSDWDFRYGSDRDVQDECVYCRSRSRALKTVSNGWFEGCGICSRPITLTVVVNAAHTKSNNANATRSAARRQQYMNNILFHFHLDNAGHKYSNICRSDSIRNHVCVAQGYYRGLSV